MASRVLVSVAVLVAASTQPPIVGGTASGTASGGVHTVTWTQTIPAGTTGLVVLVATRGTGGTFVGDSVAGVNIPVLCVDSSTAGYEASIAYIQNPAAGANHTIVARWSGTPTFQAGYSVLLTNSGAAGSVVAKHTLGVEIGNTETSDLFYVTSMNPGGTAYNLHGLPNYSFQLGTTVQGSGGSQSQSWAGWAPGDSAIGWVGVATDGPGVAGIAACAAAIQGQ